MELPCDPRDGGTSPTFVVSSCKSKKKKLENHFFDIDHTILFAVILTSGGACIAKNVSKPSSASKPLDSPGVTKSVDPQAEKNARKY